MITTETIMRDVDEATKPGTMTQQEALDFLERLSADIEARIDGLRSDLED